MQTLKRTITSGHDGHTWLVFAALGGLILGLIAAPLVGGSPAVVKATDTDTAEHTISVTGSGLVTVKPDVADVSLGVQVQRQSAKAARNDAASAMSAVIAALKSLGIADDDIKTTTIDLSPIYDYNSGSRRITGYQVTNMVAVHVRDLSVLPDVIDDSVAAGATDVGGISFDVEDRSAAENQARDAAVRDARSHADTLAAAAGVTITGVASINETSVSTPWPWYGVADMAGASAEAPTPVQPGTTDVTISVSIVYLIG